MTARKKQPLPFIAPAVSKICNSTTTGYYSTTQDGSVQSLRPGAEITQQHPSRTGDHLYHRDGRITTLCGKLLGHHAKSYLASNCAGNHVCIK